jgi:predicted membrane channel-forming protein YqfA (hemolysin III family)
MCRFTCRQRRIIPPLTRCIVARVFPQGQWHRLDNIGSIMCFVNWGLYLMDLRSPMRQRYLQYFFLAVVLVFQEKNPWDERNSVLPILLSFACLLFSFVARRRVPSYDYAPFVRGLLLLLCGVGCFVRGLDDDHDPFRFFHGCWHAFVGAAAYYNFKVLPSGSKTSLLPSKIY